MKKILRIFEQEEEEELNDFQKILALNKKKISPYDVEFFNSEGNDFSDVITVEQDGLMFTFDGLEEYLRFFFLTFCRIKSIDFKSFFKQIRVPSHGVS